jgi:hypothetical protein
MSCGCSKNAESCGCGSKVMNWESYDRPSKTMMAESWGETDQATMEEFFGYYDASPDQRVAIMLEEDEFGYDLPSLEWYFQNSLNGQGDWMTANYGKDNVEEALARVQGRMGKTNKFGYQAESLHRMHSHCFDCQCELNSKTHKMDTSGSEGGAGGGHGALCDSCFVGSSKMRLDKKAEEPTVQEPDFMPNGDGRAIGQQNFAINLSPLHAESFNAEKSAEKVCIMCDGEVDTEYGSYTQCEACGKPFHNNEDCGFEGGIYTCVKCLQRIQREMPEELHDFEREHLESFNAESRFDKLSNEIADEYEEKGMSPEKAQEVGDATAAKIGRAKYGKTGMRNMQKKGMRADMVGSPSPTFNENITGQDGPSENPTNQVFNAMRRMAPSSRDVESARRMLSGSGYGTVIYDRYLVNQQGSSNKFYYTAISEKDGQYFPMGAYGRIGYLGTLFNVAGKKERPYTSYPTMEQAYRQIREKEEAKINARKSEKKYVDYTLSRGAETLAEIEGPTAEATSGGLHSPSSFDITWEDGMGQSSASLPPNEIAWAETKGSSLGTILAIGVASAVGYFGYKKMAASKVDDKKAEKGCGTCKKSENRTVRKDSEFSVGQINPVEVEGQNDVYGAEELSSPQTSAKVAEPNWGPQSTHLSNQRPSQKMW